jgi:hypothetical protein
MRDIGRSRSHYRTVIHGAGGYTRYLITFEHWCQVWWDSESRLWKAGCMFPGCHYWRADESWGHVFRRGIEHARNCATARVVSDVLGNGD